jgi:hypothetical protein
MEGILTVLSKVVCQATVITANFQTMYFELDVSIRIAHAWITSFHSAKGWIDDSV